MRMKKVFAAVLWLLTAACWAQSKLTDDFIQKGIATQEMGYRGMTAAHPSLPIGSKPMVKNLYNDKEIEVTIAGRIQPSADRIIDLSYEAAEAIGIQTSGAVTLYFAQIVQPSQSLPLLAQAAPPPEQPPPPVQPTPPPEQPAPPPVQPEPPPEQPAPPPVQPAPSATQSVPQVVQSVPQVVQSVPQVVQSVPPPVQPAPPPEQPAPPPAQPVPPSVQFILPSIQFVLPPVQPAPPPVQSAPPPVQPAPRPVQPAPRPIQPTPPPAAPPSVQPSRQEPAGTVSVRILPGLPAPNNGKVYRLQVGAYSSVDNAAVAAQLIKDAGFDSIQEQYGTLYRVSAVGIASKDVYNAAQLLGAKGFNEIWLREYTGN